MVGIILNIIFGIFLTLTNSIWIEFKIFHNLDTYSSTIDSV